MLLNQAVYGDPFQFLEVQREHWFKRLAPPWEGIGSAVGWLGDADLETALMNGVTELAAVAIGLAATGYAAFRSEARRVGEECVRTGRYRWPPLHKKQKRNT